MGRPALMPLDRGWSWVVAVAASGIFGVIGGGLKSVGIIYVEAVEHYGSNVKSTLWIFTMSQAITLTTGALLGIMIRRTSHRTVISAGVFVMAAGIIASGYLPRIEFMFLTWTAIHGLGASCLYIGGLTCTAAYFDKHKGLAVGITGAGSGLWAFILPNVLRVCFDTFTFEGALLLYGGIVLNVLVFAILVRPSTHYAKYQSVRRSQQSVNATLVKISNGARGISQSQAVSASSTGSAHESGVSREASGEWRNSQSVAPKVEEKLLGNQVASLCSNVGLWTIGLTNVFALCGISVVYAAIPPHAGNIGVSKSTAAMLIAVGGAVEILARPFHGWVSDRKLFSSIGHVAACALITGVSALLCPIVGGTVGVAVISVTLGVCGTSIMSLMPIVVRDLLGADNVDVGMGFQMAFQGSSFILSTLVVDFIVTTTGAWAATFYFIGGSLIMASIVAGTYALWLRAFCRTEATQQRSLQKAMNME